MKKGLCLIINFICITQVNAGSGSGWAGFAGGVFTGALLSNAFSQPREVIVQQPVQREVIYQPVNNYPQYNEYRPQQTKPAQRRRPEIIDEEIENDEAKVWQAKADAARAETERINAAIELEKVKNNNNK